uniref:Uncharacterized protein n=2 Tax=Schistocephalus solidus TaxID=70667 RepID=A0A0X3NZ09_SCHSO
MNEEDEEFLPASHPLNAYLKSIDLDEDVEQSSFQTQTFDISKDPISPSKPQQLGLLQYFYMKVRKMKAAMIKMIATSDILVEDDTYIVHHYLSALDTPGDGRKTHLPSPFLLVSVGFAFVLASLHFMSLLFCLFAPLFIVLPFFASHFLLRDILARISYFHASFRKSILFLQGLACSERGLTFIAIRTGQGRISTTCFPQFMAQLHQNLAGYIVTASEVSVTAHNACRLYSLLELGGHLSDLSPDVLAAISEPSLRSVRGLHEFLLFLDSEVLQRMAWLLSSESGFSVRSGCKFYYFVPSLTARATIVSAFFMELEITNFVLVH